MPDRKVFKVITLCGEFEHHVIAESAEAAIQAVAELDSLDGDDIEAEEVPAEKVLRIHNIDDKGPDVFEEKTIAESIAGSVDEELPIYLCCSEW